MKTNRSLSEWQTIRSGLQKLDVDIMKMSIMIGKHGYLKYGDMLYKLSRILKKIRSGLNKKMYKEYPDLDLYRPEENPIEGNAKGE